MQLKYYASAMLAFLIWGLFSLALRPLSGFPSLDILLYRVGIASVVMLLISLLFRRKITRSSLAYIRSLPKKHMRNLLLNIIGSAVLLALNWFIFIYVMNNVSVNATSLAYLICPILTTVIASLFLRERLNAGQWVAVGLGIVSCFMLAYGHFMDAFYSFAIALTYATYLVLQKANNRLDKFFSLTLHIVGSTVMLLPLYQFIPTDVVHDMGFYGYISLIAVLFTIIPLFLNTYALKGLDSAVVGILLYLNPILSFLLAIYYFKESINFLQVLAYGLIFLAVIVFNVSYFIKIRKSTLQTS